MLFLNYLILHEIFLGKVVPLTLQTKREEVVRKVWKLPKAEGDLFKALNIGKVNEGPRFLGSHFMTL